MLGSDASGAVMTYSTLLSDWAEVEFVKGIDQIRGGQTTTQTFLTVKMNYRAGVLSNMRVQLGTDVFVIQSIENVKRMNAKLILNCIALGANGA